jgi:YggT family protein
MEVLLNTLVSFVSIYSVLLIIRVLLTWFPQVNWYAQPFQALRDISDPYLNLFRSFIPPMGGWDLSPMVAIFALQLISGTLGSLTTSSF